MLNASKHEAGRKIRSPFRVVIDDDVDRAQVYRWRHHSRALLIARGFVPAMYMMLFHLFSSSVLGPEPSN